MLCSELCFLAQFGLRVSNSLKIALGWITASKLLSSNFMLSNGYRANQCCVLILYTSLLDKQDPMIYFPQENYEEFINEDFCLEHTISMGRCEFLWMYRTSEMFWRRKPTVEILRTKWISESQFRFCCPLVVWLCASHHFSTALVF